MQQAFPPISPELRKRLDEQGLQPYEEKPLPDWVNPHSKACKICITRDWATNFGIFGICLLGRSFALKTRGPKMFWSITALSLPLIMQLAYMKLDNRHICYGHRYY